MYAYAYLKLKRVPQLSREFSCNGRSVYWETVVESLQGVFLREPISLGHGGKGTEHTFVTGDPAVSFSTKSGIANLPKAGVACKQDLQGAVIQSRRD